METVKSVIYRQGLHLLRKPFVPIRDEANNSANIQLGRT